MFSNQGNLFGNQQQQQPMGGGGSIFGQRKHFLT